MDFNLVCMIILVFYGDHFKKDYSEGCGGKMNGIGVNSGKETG